MSGAAVVEHLMQGSAALDRGDWDAARAAFETVLAQSPDPEERAQAILGLSDALWWTSRLEEAIAAREDAYALQRQLGRDEQAAMTSLWLALEWHDGIGDVEVARTWLARAATLAGENPPPGLAGRIELYGGAIDEAITGELAQHVVELARSAVDADLEAQGASCGAVSKLLGGDLDAAANDLDEAMTLATGDESSLMCLAWVCADYAFAVQAWGDARPFQPWSAVVARLAAERGHPEIIAIAATCAAETMTAAGDWGGAERALRDAIETLSRTGHTGRLAAPTAQLADLLGSQGRFEEASVLLSAGEDHDAALLPRARIALGRGQPDLAVTLTERSIRRLGGDSLVTAPALGLLVDAHLARSDVAAAAAASRRLDAVAEAGGAARARGRAALARGKVLAAEGETEAAIDALEAALDLLPSVAPGSTELADAHAALASVYAGTAPDVAASEARAAIAGYAKAGASHRADAAASLLRTVGQRTAPGPRTTDAALTARERDVLRLIGAGLTNAEIAERLFLSPKTVNNHVTSILAKLGVRTRVEAAVYAVAHPQG
jgi:DNA-binding NarL/FixJ family response regulator